MKGVVTRIYHENENGFMIARFNMENNKYYTILGELYGLKRGDTIQISDYCMEEHKDFGKQIRVLSWNKCIPSTRKGVIEFMRSGFIKGVGDKRANMIVDMLGENALDIIGQNGPAALSGVVPGIGKILASNIHEAVVEHQHLQNIVQELSVFGMSFKMIMKAYKHFGSGVANIIRINPYKLIDLAMVSFIKADVIAKKVGVKPMSTFRIAAAIDHVFKMESQNNGHCYLTYNDVIGFVKELLGKPTVDQDCIGEVIEQRLNSGHLIIEGSCLYARPHYFAEKELVDSINNLRRVYREPKDIEKVIESCIGCSKITLSAEQREAVKMVFANGLSVLTGGPGTGKTQTVRTLVESAKRLGVNNISLCAPTGRAAKVLNIATGHNAQTIHRLLEMQPGGHPSYNASNKLSCDILVVDEASMMDLFLARDLFEALPIKTHVLLVGDRDQLPPVGPGNVLKDILAAGVPHVNLTHIYRQSGTSDIVVAAHTVNRGGFPSLTGGNGFYFIEKKEPLDVADAISRSYKRLLAKGYSSLDIQVLSPMRKGDVGINNLNKILQDIYNPMANGKKEIKYGSTIYRVGDKVMQIKNDYEKQVFNGEMGVILFIGSIKDGNGEETENSNDGLIIKYNGREVVYARDELESITLAYAITVHKSQGCEYPAVILALTTQHYILLARNLVYTAISRAKDMLVLIGTKKALAIAIENNRVAIRNTELDRKLRKVFGKT